MALLGLYGPHACGKTTFVKGMWNILTADGTIELLPDLAVVLADNSNTEYRVTDGKVSIVRPEGRNLWKYKVEYKRDLYDAAIADDSRLWIVESVRFDVHRCVAQAFMEYGGGAHILVLTLDWKTMRQFMMERCEDKGKDFNHEYWQPGRLEYEGCGRFVNQAIRSLRPAGVPYDVYRIDADREAWGIVEEKFRDLVFRPVEEWYPCI